MRSGLALAGPALLLAVALASRRLVDASEFGVDGQGQVFESVEELWSQVKTDGGKGAEQRWGWYSKAVQYWDMQEASDDGVLGGYGQLSEPDVRDSHAFLLKAFGPALTQAAAEGRRMAALDCGAGVGRVSEKLLMHHFHEVDLVEPSAHLLEKAQQRLGSPEVLAGLPEGHKAVHFHLAGLEQHNPQPGRYDVIWLQWAALYLTDEDLLAFLQRSAAALKPGGMLVVKENVSDGGFVVDNEDASITRRHDHYLELFSKAGLQLLHTALQTDFPTGVFKVRMYALEPQAARTCGSGATEAHTCSMPASIS